MTATINNAGQFLNNATANAAEFDPDTSDNASSVNAVATSSTDLSITKTLDTAGPFLAGQSISFTLVALNSGPSPAVNVQLTDTPANLTITGVSGGCTTLPCTIVPALLVNQPRTINVTATINALGAFDNSATVTGQDFDPDLSNNTDDDGNGGTAVPPSSVDLALTKTASAESVKLEEPFDYTLVLTKNGPGAATGVVVTDPLPANFSLISATSTQGTCAGTTTVTCTIGTMLNDASVTMTIRGFATSTGTLVNTATASANEAETVTANNTSSVAVNAFGDIPTVSGLMLIALTLLLAGAGVFFVKR